MSRAPGAPGARVLAVASGKGGVGKTSVAVHLALALAARRKRVCLLDADLGLANVDILLGLSPSRTLEDVLFDDLPLEQALVRAAPGLDVLPGSSGVQRMADLPRVARERLVREAQKLMGYDLLIVDTSPGISRQIVSLCLAAGEVVVVTTPEATSVTDAYALIKVMVQNGLARRPHLLINRAKSQAQARLIFEKLDSTARRYLNRDCGLLGVLPDDAGLSRAAALRRPLREVCPAAGITRAFDVLAESLADARGPLSRAGRIAPDFFRDFLVRAMAEAAQAEPPLKTSQQKMSAAKGGTLPGLCDRLAALDDLVKALPNATDGAGARAIYARLADELTRLRRDAALAENRDPESGLLKPRPKAALLCDDPAMREVLADILDEVGLSPFDAPPDGKLPDFKNPPALAVACWDGPPTSLAAFADAVRGSPLLTLPGLGTDPTPCPGAVVVRRPFRLDELRRTIVRLSNRPAN
ncbi:Cobyrinic acid ac-diamide synthase [Alkalidesulfovibrio alkalitolerans DSM 16529]|uniref:Cobyrinic acid ac-diamide synthase n=1 Tax=Alkalidesulfovibrio alkalitolerans DSM 16529 TaxID=1121439 RepID=S7URE7_9BACT|nr:MinD/ParA family protein [Alkalidesulfovibrio alkalitolerans]EPR34878.1 Cobyrinic acid ac-diamide synthase [Alkalidesulfovibrio alkalitolerans DSM 16529]